MKTKKILALVLVLATILSMLAACGSSDKSDGPIKISIDEWIGYKSLLDANGGLITAPGSINDKLGISVEYVVINDHNVSSAALISGELAGAGYTVNRYAFLQDKFDEAGLEVQIPFITNFSNGGDGIISRSDIVSINDLVGKKVAVPRFTESQTLLEWLINNSSLTDTQRKKIRDNIVYCETADETAKAFFSGSVDAAATWEPYLTMAASSTDSRILFDTSMSTNLILSALVFNKEFMEDNEEFVVKLIDGALQARGLYKTDFSYIRQMPLFEMMTDQDIIDMAMGADLTTWTQNTKLLNNEAITMYEEMANVWNGLGTTAHPEKAENAFTDEYIMQLKDKYEGEVVEEDNSFVTGDIDMIIESPDALLTYSADIKFALNSREIQKESYDELDEFVKVAKVLNGVYIQIEGNASKRADHVSEAMIVEFSRQRADSIKKYFISQGIPEAQILDPIGNGDLKPADPDNPAAPENRRTEIFFKPVVGY